MTRIMNRKRELTRTQKAKLNMFFSLLQQGVVFICGLIVPKLMLNAFGSEAYGATASIATFLSYITLLEGGIGAVTRSALYKAFASKSNEQVSTVVSETKWFYRKIAYAFTIYVIILACFYKQISHNSVFGYWYSFSLVIVIALSTFAEYFIGISYSLLLQADQMNYIAIIFRIITTMMNTVGIVVLTSLKCDILAVKLLSSTVFVIRPLLLSFYVKRRYQLKEIRQTETLLVNKGSAVGQHIAWALHNNTDITVLTLFKDLTDVSVYSVHSMVVGQLQSILSSFTSGMEAVFGSMYANGEKENLQKTFGYYETLISILSVTMLSVATVLIVPFIKLYTSGVTDAQYVNPFFAIMLIIASVLYCFRSPYHQMVIAAGRFKETRIAAYGESLINIVSSIILVIKFGIVGVAIGTVLATLFRFVYYVWYLSKHVLHRSVHICIKRMTINTVVFASICVLCNIITLRISMDNYFEFAIAGILVSLISGVLTLLVYYVFYKEDVMAIMIRGFNRIKK